MPNRILREGILDSERVDRLSAEAEVFYRRVMSVADDYGRYEADPVILRARCYPRRTDRITVAQIQHWIYEVQQAELLTCYRVGRKTYIQLSDFNQQLRSKSKFPDPAAINCEQLISVDSNCSELCTDSNTNTNTDTHPNTTPDGKAPQVRSNVTSFPSPVVEPEWFEFRETAEANGIGGSEVDWDEAYRWGWRVLGIDEKLAATKGILDRRGTDDPALKSLPQNYLKRKMWTRPIRSPTMEIRRHRNIAAELEAL